MFDEYMKQFEVIIGKDEYDRTNFEEKITKREKKLKELNQNKRATIENINPKNDNNQAQKN